MRKEKEQEELWLQKEVIEFLRCASSTFFTAKRYEKLRAKAIKDGSRRKYKKSDVLAFVEYLQKFGEDVAVGGKFFRGTLFDTVGVVYFE